MCEVLFLDGFHLGLEIFLSIQVQFCFCLWKVGGLGVSLVVSLVGAAAIILSHLPSLLDQYLAIVGVVTLVGTM